jgi:hypothetical protein
MMRSNSPNKLVMGNYAGLPGTGPADEICLHCKHLRRDTCTRFVCGQYMTMMKRKGRAISAQAPACRYFEHKNKGAEQCPTR